jgi:hypothetical protein
MTTKTKNIIKWSLTGVVGLIFLASGMSKIIVSTETAQMAQTMNLHPKAFTMIGVLEILSIVLFILPRTGVIGTLLLAAYMGGAIAVHLTQGLSIVAPAIIEALIWITAVLKFPELMTRFFPSQQTAKQ